MRINPNDYTQRYNTKKNNRPNYTSPLRPQAYDSFERAPMQNDVSFNGLFGMFKPKVKPEPEFPPIVPADVDKDKTTLLQKEIDKIKSQVVLEINELLFSNECTPEKKERLKKLINSDYMTYKANYFSPRDKKEKELNLCDYIKDEPINVNKELFEEFLISSFTRSKINLSSYIINPKLEIHNKTMENLFNKFLTMDKSSPDTRAILNMAEAVKKCKIDDFNFNNYLVNCIKNNKSDMYKIIFDRDNIYLGQKVSKDSDRIVFDEILQSDNPDIKGSIDKKVLQYRIDHAIMKSYLSIPENKTVEEISEWSPLYKRESNFAEGFLKLFAEYLSYDEKIEFLNELFKQVRLNKNNQDFKNYYFLLASIGYDIEENFKFPQGQFVNIGKANGFSINKNEIVEVPPNPADTPQLYQSSKVLKEKFETLINTEVFNLDDFKKTYDEIEEYPIDNNKFVQFALNNLPNIFVTPENEEQYKQIIENIKHISGDFSKTDNLGNNLAHLAIIAENPYLIELAIDKDVSFNEKNSAGETAIDLIDKYEGNPKVLDVLKSLRINCPELLDFAQNDITSGIKMIINDKLSDINSRNPETKDTAWTVGAKNNAVDVMKLLASHPELDKNAVNIDGDNAGILAAKEGNIEVIKILNELEDFDINYINPKTNDSVFTTAKDEKTLDEIMKNKNADPNVRLENGPPAIFKNLQKTYSTQTEGYNPTPDFKRFDALSKYKKTDLSITYNSINIMTFMDNCILNVKNKGYSERTCQQYAKNLAETIRNKYFISVKDMIEKEGIISLDKIKEYIDYPKAEKFINKPLNQHDEPIGFFLADIEINRKNVSQFLEIIKTLQEKGYDFQKKNSFGQTLLDKSKDAENEFLVEYLQKKTIIKNEYNKKKQ